MLRKTFVLTHRRQTPPVPSRASQRASARLRGPLAWGLAALAATFAVPGPAVDAADGTRAGPRLVRGIIPRGAGHQILETAAFHGRLVFTRQDTGTTWQTDGTAAGTVELAPSYTIEGAYGLGMAGGRLS